MSGRRGQLVLGAILAAAVVVGALIAISASGGNGGGSGTLKGVAAVQAELDGIPQRGATLGRADAPVEITEYADLQCPFCAQAAESTLPQVVARFVRPGKAKLTLRPLAFIGEDSVRGAKAVVAAGRQDRLWQTLGVLFRSQGGENSGWLTDDLVRTAVAAVGADPDRVMRDATDQATEATLNEASAKAKADSVESTPTFVVRGPGGVQYLRGAADIGAFERAIAAVSG